ncbi:MAG TPA: PAS domain S-box protein [Anaeromyxobacter sp.]
MARRSARPGSRPGGVKGLGLPGELAAAALAVVLAVGFGGYLSFRRVNAARELLVGEQMDALVETVRLREVSAIAARLAREFLITGDPRTLAASVEHRDEARALLVRAAARPDTAALAGSLLAEQDASDARWDALAAARARAGPADLVERFEREVVPPRRRTDAGLDALERVRRAAFEARRRELEGAARTAFAGLFAATALGITFSVLLWLALRRSVGALRASEDRFRSIFENAPVGVADVGLDGRWLRVNPRYRDILGYSEEELRGMTADALTHPDDVAPDRERSRRLRAGELDAYGIEKRYVRKDGTVAWVNLTASLVRDPAGRPSYYVAAAEDVAARKAVEQDLRDAVDARDEFMRIASHELRTPLTSLRLQVESLRAVLARGGVEPDRVAAKADAALRQVSRLADLVDGLLDVSQLDPDRLSIAPQEGDLAEAIREAVAGLSGDAARRQVEVRFSAPDTAPASFDRARVQQAVAHLLSNALKFGQGRPVDVTVETSGDTARVAVRDRGIGVDAREHERIFGRFERAVPSSHYGGFGLGLFMARRIAEGHGGSVRLESPPGGGSTFVLELPLRGPRGAPARAGARSSS